MTIIETIAKKSNEMIHSLCVYLSAPHQSKKDLVICKAIESELTDILGLTYFSSRQINESLRKSLIGVDSEEKQKLLYTNNENNIIQKIGISALVIAVVNDRDYDSARWFDIGIARTLGKLIVVYTDNKNILEGSYFNFPFKVVSDYKSLSKLVSSINEVYNKTPFINRIGDEVRYYPISEEFKLEVKNHIKEEEEKSNEVSRS